MQHWRAISAHRQSKQRASSCNTGALCTGRPKHKAQCTAIAKRAAVPRLCRTLQTHVRGLFNRLMPFYRRRCCVLQTRVRGRQRSGTSLTSHGLARPRLRCRSAAATSRCPDPPANPALPRTCLHDLLISISNGTCVCSDLYRGCAPHHGPQTSDTVIRVWPPCHRLHWPLAMP